MPDLRYDVLGIGNAIVDVISHATDDFLIRHDLKKDSMELVDAERSDDAGATGRPERLGPSGQQLAEEAGVVGDELQGHPRAADQVANWIFADRFPEHSPGRRA